MALGLTSTRTKLSELQRYKDIVRCVPLGLQVHHQEQPSRPLINVRFDRKALVTVDLKVGWALLDPPFSPHPLS